MKVLLLDTSDIPYSLSISKALSRVRDLELTVITRYSSHVENAYRFYYRWSDRCEQPLVRKTVRGLEYFIGCVRTAIHVCFRHYDIIHIQWGSLFFVDRLFWNYLKSRTDKLVFTAHDVIPHDQNPKVIAHNQLLFSIPDTIIVHGDFCKAEIHSVYPQFESKIYVQKHGMTVLPQTPPVTEDTVNRHLSLLDAHLENRIVIGALGQIDDYKGVDLLIEAVNQLNRQDVYLIIAGKTIERYKKKFDDIKSKLNNPQIYIYNRFFSDEEEAYFYDLADIAATTYKSASMSGVLFTAAGHQKTLLSTTVGCIGDVIRPCSDLCYLC